MGVKGFSGRYKVRSERLEVRKGLVHRGWFGGGDCLLGGASAEPRDPGRVQRSGRRTPCAERAVMLTAVQSLRLAGTEGGALGRGASTEPRVPGLVERAGLNGAGPAGWLRESGSRLSHSKAFGWLVRRGCWRAHWVRRESCDSDRVEVLANAVGPAMMESVQT